MKKSLCLLTAICALLLKDVECQTLPVTHGCSDQLLIADYATCMESLRTTPAPAPFTFAFSDGCVSNLLNECFYDSTNDVYDCTYNAVNYEIACACPSPGWTEGRMDATYLPGRTCNDVNECTLMTDACDPFRSTCSNNQGSYTCTCTSGYTSTTDFSCELPSGSSSCNVNASPVCHIHATCASITREQGCYSLPAALDGATPDESPATAYECLERCHDFGYTYAVLTGGNQCYCTDDAPGSSVTSTLCDQSCGPTDNEKCGDSTRAYANYYITGPDHTCTCNAGYVGDGETCSETNECTTATIPNNAQCTDLVNDFLILCNSGFIFNGMGECIAVNELDCSSIDNPETDNTLNRLEQWASDCSRVRFLNCDGSGTAEEVETGTTAGSSACMSGSLVSTYDSDSFTFSEFNTNTSWALLTPVVTCGATTFSVVLDRSVLNAAEFSLADMALGDYPSGMDPANYPSECRGRRYADPAGLRYIFEHDFSNKCGVTRTVSSSSEEIITFLLTGISDAQNTIVTRRALLRYEMVCTYAKTQTINSGSTFHVYTPSRRRRDLLSTDNQLTLQAKSDATFSSALDISSPLTKGDIAYLEVDLPSLEDNYALQWLQCWQSDSADPKLGKKRVILENGCLASNGDKLKNSVTIYKNTATKSQLAFFPTSFSGGESEDIYIHCVVNKCDQSGDQTCSEVCTGIGGDDKGSVTLLSTTETVTSGKIVLKDVCGGSGNGGCEQLCSVSEDNRAVCGCVRGFQVDPDDSKMCKGVPVPNPSASTGNPNVKWYYIAIPVVAVVLIAVAILVARKVNEGKAKSYKMPDLADLGEDP